MLSDETEISHQQPLCVKTSVSMSVADGKLIVLVQQHECLYNQAHTDYSDAKEKRELWSTIGKQLGFSGK